MIRAARPADAEDERSVERAAGARFAGIQMSDVAAHEPISAQELADYARDGRSWVATDADDRAVGYVIADVVAGCAHVEQVSVHPDHQGAGLGRALLEEVERWAETRGLHGVTLTTFKDVAWNRPLYEHLGFTVLAESELSPELRQIRDAETARGLDPSTRVCMHKPLAPPGAIPGL
jgi:GNAT superfamily N-acetyltransferase